MINALRATPRNAWHERTVAESMAPVDDVAVVESTSALTTLLTALEGNPERRGLVVDGGRLVGIVAPSDIARLLSLVEIASRPLDPASP